MLEVMKMTLMVVVKMMVMRQFDHYNDDDICSLGGSSILAAFPE